MILLVMDNGPFRFSKSHDAVTGLLGSLAELGLHRTQVEEERCLEAWRFECSHKPQSCLSLLWHRQFWPDGVEEEDSRVEVSVDGTLVGEVQVDQLLRKKLSRSLRAEIAMQVLAICSRSTGQSA